MAKENDTYKVAKVIKSRIWRYKKKTVIQYLLQWRKYGPKYDEWQNEDKCLDCISAINEFLVKENTSPPPIFNKLRAILRLSLQNANQNPKLLPTNTTNQKVFFVRNKKRLIDPELMSTKPSLLDSRRAMESKLVLSIPLPKSTSLPEHQTTLVK